MTAPREPHRPPSRSGRPSCSIDGIRRRTADGFRASGLLSSPTGCSPADGAGTAQPGRQPRRSAAAHRDGGSGGARHAAGGARLSGRGAFRRTGAAFLVVLAAAVAFVPTAQGQTEVTLGSNLDQSGAGTATVTAGTWLAVPVPAPERGQATLTAVTLDISTHGEGLTVAIHLNFLNANNNNVPVADALYALNPPSVRGTGLQTFTAPENAIIKKNTRYWIVFSVSASGETSEISYTDTGNEDLSDPHLFIGNGWDVSTDGATWNTLEEDKSIRMRFSGYPPAVVGTPFTMTLEIPDLDPVEGAGGRLHSFVDVKLSRPVWIPYKDMRDNAFDVINATIVKAMRMPGSKTRRYYDGRRRTFSDHWRLEVRPDDDDTSFTITSRKHLCGDRGGMCTSDGGSPGNYPVTDALIPAGVDLSVSIADTTASEADGVIVFTVSLSRATAGTVEVDFETTTEGTATEGVDFRSGKSLLVLFPEETTYDISVELFDDAVDGETVIAKLTGARLVQFDPVRRKEKRSKITIADDEATGTINNGSGGSDGDEEDGLLALVGDVTPKAAAAALFGGDALIGDQLAALDQLGNRNGAYDLGDLLSWTARCRRNELSCGGTVSATDAGFLPASPAMPPTKRQGRTPRRRRGDGHAGRRSGRNRGGSVERVPRQRAMRSGVAGREPGRHGPAVGRVTGWIRALLLGLVVSAWGCGIGEDLVQPVQPDPGPLHVQLTVPPEARDIGAMLVVEGPGIDSLSAPGFELIQADEASSNRREAIVAGSLSTGPVLQVWVPDRRYLADYRVTLMQVSGDDYGLRDVAEYRAVITSN